jgi:hypothetical protein
LKRREAIYLSNLKKLKEFIKAEEVKMKELKQKAEEERA